MTENTKKGPSKAEKDDDFGFDEDAEFDNEHLFEDSEFEAEGWSIPHDPESVTRVLKSLEGLLPGILRRAESYTSRAAESRAAGASASGSEGEASEESARSSEGFRARLGGTKLPREVVNFIFAQVDTTKREFLRIASNEVRLFLESVDLGGEVAKILTSLSFEVRMEVRFIPNDQAVKPSARGRVRVKRNRSADDDAAGEDEVEAEDVATSEEGEEIAGRELSDVFNPRRWTLRRRPRQEDEGLEESPLKGEVQDEAKE